MNLHSLLNDFITVMTPYDEGVQCYIDGDPPEFGRLIYIDGSYALEEFARGWMEACEYAN